MDSPHPPHTHAVSKDNMFYKAPFQTDLQSFAKTGVKVTIQVF